MMRVLCRSQPMYSALLPFEPNGPGLLGRAHFPLVQLEALDLPDRGVYLAVLDELVHGADARLVEVDGPGVVFDVVLFGRALVVFDDAGGPRFFPVLRIGQAENDMARFPHGVGDPLLGATGREQVADIGRLFVPAQAIPDLLQFAEIDRGFGGHCEFGIPIRLGALESVFRTPPHYVGNWLNYSSQSV